MILIVPLLRLGRLLVHIGKDKAAGVRQQRNNVHNCIVSTVLKNGGNEFGGVDDSLRRKRIREHLDHSHGLSRSDGKCIELPCVICAYPHRDDYVGGTLSAGEIKGHVQKGGGFKSNY